MIQLVIMIGRHRDLHLADRHHIDVILLQVGFDLQLFAFGDEASSGVPAAHYDALPFALTSVPIRDVHVFVNPEACNEAG